MTYPSEIMTVTELSAFLKVRRDLVLQWCHVPGNQFAYVNPGGRKIRIKTHEFETWYRTKRKYVGGRR